MMSVFSNDICSIDGIGNDVIMCPNCDFEIANDKCKLWTLNESCTYSKVGTIVYCIY